jgi:hypothetical protein
MDDRDESPVRASLTEFGKWLQNARRFWKTRRAVLTGKQVWEIRSTERQSEGYLGPWKFNLFQTAIAGGCAGTLTRILDLVSPAPQPVYSPVLSNPELDKLFYAAKDFLDPFSIPVLLTVFVFLVGWGSLKGKDSSRQKRERARAAYLYLDAAYGFWSQLSLAVFWAIASSHLTEKKLGEPTWLVGLFVGVSIWQLYVSGSKVPKLLFRANGYSNRVTRCWRRRLPNDPPWNKLLLANVIQSVPIFLGLQFLIVLLAYGYAYAMQSLRNLVLG